MVKLLWMQVDGFRSVKPGTRLSFNAGPNVLLGQNGTGKTTLLDLIVAAVTSDFTGFKDEPFALSYALSSAEATLTVSVRNEQPLSAETSDATRLCFTAEFVGRSTGGRFTFDVEGEKGSVQCVGEAGPRIALKTFGPQLGLTVTGGLTLWWSRRSEPKAQQWLPETYGLFREPATRRFDEALGCFNELVESRIELRQAPEVSLSGHTSPAGSLKERVMIRAMRDWGAAHYVLSDAELPFLQRAVQLLDFDSAEARVELQDAARDELGQVMRLGHLRFSFRHRNGRRVTEKMLSHGQKRMLAFSHHAVSMESVIVADELTNGLNHPWIRACFEMMGEKQLFLTSQNPLLLDYLGFQSVDDVQSTFVLCRWDKAADQMRWKNMSEEEARDLFDSYMVGFQRLGELLQQEGLW